MSEPQMVINRPVEYVIHTHTHKEIRTVVCRFVLRAQFLKFVKINVALSTQLYKEKV